MTVAAAPAATVLEIDGRDAVKVSRWISHCGGVAVWGCLDWCAPRMSYFTPALLTDGSPSRCPHWSSPPRPEHIVTDAAEVVVVEHTEVRRVRIAVRRGYGLRTTLTDAASVRLRKALDSAGEGADYAFEGGEAIILAVSARTPLPEWLAEHPDAKA